MSTAPYQCTLTPELQDKAKNELNEDPEWRSKDVAALRDMVNKYTGLKCRTDDAFLLRFLRARKFDHQRAFDLLLNYFKKRKENPDIFENFTPMNLKHMLEAGVSNVLDCKDKLGRRIILLRIGRWDPDRYPVTDVMRTQLLNLEKIIQDEETQVSGLVVLVDAKGMTWNHGKHFNPFFAKKLMSIIQEGMPIRLKGIHYFNEPSFMGTIFEMIKPFMKEKIKKRVNFHGDRKEELLDVFPKELMPEEYGGDQPPFNHKAWTEKMYASEEQFKEMAKYELESYVPIKEENQADAIGGVTGTFKKLNVD